MQANKTIVINGRLYDAVTGMPIKGAATARPVVDGVRQAGKTKTVDNAIHTRQQRSQTLHRRAVKKPTPTEPKRDTPGAKRHMDIARGTAIRRFATHPQQTRQQSVTPDRKPTPHPIAAKVLQKSRPKKAAATAVSAKDIKERAISAALAPKEVATKAKKQSSRRSLSKRTRRLLAIGGGVLVAIVGAVIVYFTIPSISVNFAAQQAGVSASYPSYTPDGYAFSQPVAYEPGTVTLTFVSRSGAGSYTLTQARSSWDSTAVLESVVKPAAGNDYTTTQERGLTLYSYNDSTVWVNSGTLYTITSHDTHLQPEQIRRIATSL